MPSKKKVAGACFVIGTKGQTSLPVPYVQQRPAKIKARRKNDVLWGVLNISGAKVKLSLKNFQLLGGSAATPLKFNTNQPLALNHMKVGCIKAKVKDAAAIGTYKYDIYLDGRCALDPELEING